MKNYYVLYFAVLSFLSGFSQEKTTTEYATFTSNHFQFTIEKQCKAEICSVINVLIKKEDAIIQTISVNENENSQLQDDMVFIMEDMNFDGYIDFRIIQHLPANGNVPYYYWLYNSKTNTFENNIDYERLLSPIFDAKNKQIISSYHFKLGENFKDVYKIKNNKLLLEKHSDVK